MFWFGKQDRRWTVSWRADQKWSQATRHDKCSEARRRWQRQVPIQKTKQMSSEQVRSPEMVVDNESWQVSRGLKERTEPGSNSEKRTEFYHSGFTDYYLHLYCYIHNVSADMSFGLLQVFVELGSLQGTSNHVLYLIHGGRFFWSVKR